MKQLITNNLTGETTEVEIDDSIALNQPTGFTQQKTDAERISDLETLYLQVEGII